MAAFRRSLFGIVAAAALLFGFGSFTAALACPAAYSGVQDQPDCCGQAEKADCVLKYCTAICHAMPPAASENETGVAPSKSSFWGTVQPFEPINSGPDPPPPRWA